MTSLYNDNYVKKYPADTVIIQEGEMHDNTIYILNKGYLSVFKNDKMVTQINRKGVFFGEMSVILDTPRTATVKALTNCTVTALPCDLDTMFIKFPSIAQKLMVTLARRLADLTVKYEKTVKDLLEMQKLSKKLLGAEKSEENLKPVK